MGYWSEAFRCYKPSSTEKKLGGPVLYATPCYTSQEQDNPSMRSRSVKLTIRIYSCGRISIPCTLSVCAVRLTSRRQMLPALARVSDVYHASQRSTSPVCQRLGGTLGFRSVCQCSQGIAQIRSPCGTLIGSLTTDKGPLMC